ncbi:EXPA2 [Scenedesmus sp. PABB004]|nr:EXPA2 [Scenedesmus sp. PABB004]
MAPLRALGLLLLAAALLAPARAVVDWQWRVGRATNYGAAGDPWSIHVGSCGYYYLDPTVNKGWDVAAITDAAPDYKGSCGRCYEIACAPMHLTDGYGQGMDRNAACRDPGASVTVMVTDTCPCDYPANYYSNKRWCCGDYMHFDLSSWAFEKLGERKWGVMGVHYREVPCDHCPDRPAQLPPGVAPSAAVQDPPPGWAPSRDKRPWGKMCDGAQQGQPQQQQQGQGQGAGQGAGQGQGGGDVLSWANWSYRARGAWTEASSGGATASCTTLQGGGAARYNRGAGGALQGKRRLVLTVKLDGSGQVPDVTLALASTRKGQCRGVDLRSLGGQRSGGWAALSVPLNNFAWWAGGWQSDGADFGGCGGGGGIGGWDVDEVRLRNKWGGDQALCLADVRFE